jgi:hypothetical protein
VIEVADRALFYIQLSEHWNSFINYPPELIDGLGKTVFAFVAEDDPRTVSLQARVEDQIGLLDAFVNGRRRRFLESSFERAHDSLSLEHAHVLGRLYQIRFAHGEIAARATLDKVDGLVARIGDGRLGFQDAYSGAWLSCLAGELAVRCMTGEPQRRDALLDEATAHLERARRLLPRSSEHTSLDGDLALLAVKLAVVRGDLAGARSELAGGFGLAARFLEAELTRLEGHPERALPLLETASKDANRIGDTLLGKSLRGDCAVAFYLAEITLGKLGSQGKLAELYRRRDEVLPLLPWIDRETRKALGL